MSLPLDSVTFQFMLRPTDLTLLKMKGTLKLMYIKYLIGCLERSN